MTLNDFVIFLIMIEHVAVLRIRQNLSPISKKYDPAPIVAIPMIHIHVVIISSIITEMVYSGSSKLGYLVKLSEE